MSGRLERWLFARGERVVRVAPKLMAGVRRSARTRGKSDPIDALAVARAALREGVDRLPAAGLEGRALEIRLLLDHHDDLVAQRSDEQRRLRWHLHDLFDEIDIPAGALDRTVWLDRIGRKLTRAEQGARVRIARDLIRSIRERTRRIRQLEQELAALVAAEAPQLVAEVGCGPLTAAKLVGEIAGAHRFATDAQLARAAGVAPGPRLLRAPRPPPPGPRRQPPTQLRPAPPRRQQRPPRPRIGRLPRPQTSRRQNPHGSPARPQTTPRPTHPPPPHPTHPNRETA